MEIAGIDADTIVTQLMQVERQPISALEKRKTAAQAASNAITKIGTSITAFRLAAERLSLASSFIKHSTAVSDDSIVAATIASTASPGSLAFTVDRLSQSHGLRSIGTVASNTATVTTQSTIAIASGGGALGIGSVRTGSLPTGTTTLSVIQASSAARSTGSSTPAASTVIGAGNSTFDLTVDGVARSVTIADGTYDPAGLAAALQSALDTAGVGATARITGSGALEVATTREGSAASMRVTGGSALGALGLAVDASANFGTDATIDVNGTTTVVTDIFAGASVSVGTGGGSIDIDLAGGLRVGTSDIKVVSTGDRSLAAVAAAINQAGAGVTASAVRVDTGAWRLQLTSTRTGEEGRIALDTSALTGLGGMIESSAAQDAQITIGSGPGAYSIVASGNTFTDVMPGVTLTAKKVDTTPITVTVSPDYESIADNVTKLVTAANDILVDIKVQTRSDPKAGTSGALAGNATMRSLVDRIGNALGNQVDGLGFSLPSSVGIERTREGTFKFDRAKFLEAVAADPDAVTQLFARGGTNTGDAVFASASSTTVTGSYQVDITTAATRASSALLFSGGAGAATQIGVRIGTTTATIDVAAGRSAAQIVSDLNDAFASSGLRVVAETDGTGLRVRAADWGGSGSFAINTDVQGAGSWDDLTGTDVAGTIDGIAAVGVGRRLSLSTTASSGAAGLAIDITGGVSGMLGAVTYQPGIAGRIVEVTTAMTKTETGTITTAKAFAESRMTMFGEQIDRLEDRLAIRETNLRRTWANMQTLLGSLQNQGSWISSQLAALSTSYN